jgi:hypothetical protein
MSSIVGLSPNTSTRKTGLSLSSNRSFGVLSSAFWIRSSETGSTAGSPQRTVLAPW